MTTLTRVFVLVCAVLSVLLLATVRAAPVGSPRRNQRELRETVSKMDPGVKKTVLGLHAQGVPTDAIASRIKFETKGKDAKDIIEGIKYEDSMNDPSAKKNAFKREKALKDAIRQEEKNRRKTGKR